MSPVAPPGGPGAPDEPHRLPRTVTPRHYRLRIDVDLEAARFTGTEQLSVDVDTEVDEIVLNAAELEISDARLELAGGDSIAATVRIDEAGDRATFALERPAPAGSAELHCQFTGILNDKLHGFYR
ncbi:MAG: M1 family metallopeptidase, partial [Acidimicrobiales bacterium]